MLTPKFGKIFILLFIITLNAIGKLYTFVSIDTSYIKYNSPQIKFIQDFYNLGNNISGYVSKEKLNIKNLIEEGIIDSLTINSDTSKLILYPGLAIRDIVVHGAFPLFNSEIIKIMTVGSGDFINNDIINKQSILIKEKLLQSGLNGATVSLKIKKLKKYPGMINLIVNISYKNHKIIKQVKYTGNNLYGPIRNAIAFHQWHYLTLSLFPRRYSKDDLRDDQRSIRNFYRNKGFSDVNISVKDSVLINKKNKEKNELISLNVDINKGVKTIIKYGNLAPFNKRYVRKYFDIKSKGNHNNATVKRGRIALLKDLKKIGYNSANVIISSAIKHHRNKDYRYISVSIDTNPRIYLDSIIFRGNNIISSQKLKSVMLTRTGRVKLNSLSGVFSKKIFLEDIDAIKNLYQNYGYIKVKIKNSIETNKKINHKIAVITINEGHICRIKNIVFTGIKKNSEDDIKKFLYNLAKTKKGTAFNKDDISNDKINIIREMKNNGYLYTEIQQSLEFNKDSTFVTVTYDINSHSPVVVGKIIYWGNFSTKESLLNQFIKIKEGDIFSLTKLNTGIREIRDLGIFSSVNYSIPKIDAKYDTLDIIIFLKENKSIDIVGSLGYKSDQYFYANASFLKNNLWGLNKSFSFRINYGNIKKRISATYKEPHIHRSNIMGSVSLYGENKKEKNVEYATNLFGNSYSFGYHPNDTLVASLTAGYEVKQNIGDAFYNNKVISNVFRHTILLSPQIIIDKRNSFLKPTKGTILTITSKISKGLSFTIDNYWKSEIEGKLYITFFDLVTIASRIKMGITRAYGESSFIAPDQLFYLGGTTSIRGYYENMLFTDNLGNSLAGMNSFNGSIEARITVHKNFEIPIFFDLGTLGFVTEFSKINHPKSSIGSGIRYLTPIGPIGIVYGIKLNREPQESIGAFHFSIGYTF